MQTFSKEERLCSKKVLEELIKSNSSLVLHPFKIIWSTQKGVNAKFPAQLAISVPKRNFKKAIDRNRIKRRIREAYRKNKSPFYDFLKRKNEFCLLLYIYLPKKEISYLEGEKKIILTFHRLMEEIGKKSNDTK